jgi:hypothetical protein
VNPQIINIMRIIVSFLCLLLFSCESNRFTLTFNAGETDRNQSIIQFTFPNGISPQVGEWELVNRETGATIPLQKVNDAEAVFILDQPLAADTERKYTLRLAKETKTTIQAVNNEQDLELMTGEKPLLTYNIATDCPPEDQPEYYCRSGYIHPIYSAGGAVVTDGFPVGHVHQHGLFFAWVNTTFRGDFTDFWNQQIETGTAAHQALTFTTSGSVFTGFSSQLQQISLKHGPVLDERWDLTAYDLGDYYVFDLISTQENITNDTLYINKYSYGGLGIRGNRLWNRADSLSFQQDARFLTSEGKTRIEANHSRPRWTAMYGETEKGIAGIAVFDHPENFRHPQPVRVHPEMPYFCLAPMVEAAMYIAPGATYESHYRIVTFDGPPNAKRLEAMWMEYAKPPVVQ